MWLSFEDRSRVPGFHGTNYAESFAVAKLDSPQRQKEMFEMPFAAIKVIEGVFSDDEKQRMIEKVTEAMVSVEGENLREKTVVILEEVKSGNWGIGGKTLSADDVRYLRGQ
jgi:4-oxalocrotonate tautomerase